MSLLINLKKAVMLVILFIIAGAMFWVSEYIFNSDKTEETGKRLPIYSVETKENKVALTFDAAWENSDTDELIRILKMNGIKATFFVTGDWCNRFPDDVKKLHNAGHSIQNHSYSHPHVNKISKEQLKDDTKKCENEIEKLTGMRPVLYRAPYGEYNDIVISVVEDELGYKVVQWDCDSTDWKGKSPEAMIERIEKNIKDGSILLFHTDTKNTPETLAQLIPMLKGKGYKFVVAEDLVYKDNYKIDVTGRQHKDSE